MIGQHSKLGYPPLQTEFKQSGCSIASANLAAT
nr:MAG TPA: hypothetical protein [Caudoviricetes sp.]